MRGCRGWLTRCCARSPAARAGLLRVAVPAEERSEWVARIRALQGELRGRRDGFREAAMAHLVLLLVGVARLAGTDPALREDRLIAAVFAERSLADQPFPYVFLDATYCKARVNRRVVSQAVVVGTGVAAVGRREVLGFAVGDSEDGAFWTAFLRSLKARGLGGVQLVIADAHLGLRHAVQAVLAGASVPRCRAGCIMRMSGLCRRRSGRYWSAGVAGLNWSA
jgi:hypothetical protein